MFKSIPAKRKLRASEKRVIIEDEIRTLEPRKCPDRLMHRGWPCSWMVKHLPLKQGIAGSSPAGATITNWNGWNDISLRCSWWSSGRIRNEWETVLQWKWDINRSLQQSTRSCVTIRRRESMQRSRSDKYY